MGAGLLLSLLIGWFIGGVGNWLADHLPHWPQRPLHFDIAKIDAAKALQLAWQPWRAPSGESGAHPWRNTGLAFAMALAFATGWWRVGNNLWMLGVLWLYTLWLLVVLVIDLEHRRVLNIMLPPAIVVALLAPLLTLLGLANSPTFGSALLGGLAGFGVFLTIYLIGRGRMMGAGDVKLAGVLGLMTGYPLVWATLATGIFLGGLAAIFLIVRSRAAAKSYMAYGPYLALGALLIMWIYWAG